jgi:hypothetical protein
MLQQPHTVRVLTLNLWCRHGAWRERRSVLHDGLQTLRPDVITFQETIKRDDYDQVIDLLGSDYAVVHQRGRGVDGSGASIASRFPFVDVHEASLHVTSRIDPAVGWIGSVAVAEIGVPEPIGPLLVVHHKPSWQWGFERERELQAVAAARLVETLLGHGRCMWCWRATLMRQRMLRVCDFGVVDNRWRA